jgi:hypothetical protein
LDLLPGCITGTPPAFHYHPFRYINWKEEARVQKQPAHWTAERTDEAKQQFYMDFGFMRASTSTFYQPNKLQDQIVLSFDNFTSYLLVIDKTSRYAWVIFRGGKDPLLDIINVFLTRYGHTDGKLIQTDQGGELA